MISGRCTTRNVGDYHDPLRESLLTKQYNLVTKGFEICSYEHVWNSGAG